MGVCGERTYSGNASQAKRIGRMACGAQYRCSALGRLIQGVLVNPTILLQVGQGKGNVPTVVVLLQDVVLRILVRVGIVLPTVLRLSIVVAAFGGVTMAARHLI